MFQFIVLVVSITFINGLSANWIRKNQGNYATGQESKEVMIKWKLFIVQNGVMLQLT